MARTKKNETVEETKKEAGVSQEDLLALIAQMKSTMDAQAKEIAELKENKNNIINVVENKEPTHAERTEDINRKKVTITSLYKGGTLVLAGDHSHWLQFGQKEIVPAKEAIKIVESSMKLLEQGFYTVDKWIADEFGWPVNENQMSIEELQEFFNKPTEEAVDMFLNTTDGQRTCILDYIEKRILGDGEFENINLAHRIGSIYGKDFIKLLSDNQLDDEDRAMMRKG